MDTIKPQAKNLKQLAVAYKVSQVTMRKWLRVAGLIPKEQPRATYIFTPLEVKAIYEKLGEPYED
ncbi:MAG: DUF4248 domain-containing protein [Vicingaceae bacterium]|nr:DUF4248 domain-containing protein [Vicingaceae bacterium]